MMKTKLSGNDLISGASSMQFSSQEKDAVKAENHKLRNLRIAFWIVAVVTGFVQIWLRDNIVFDDTLSYLDSGELLWRGDFANAITNHWSPGLPFLLGLALHLFHPAGLWELVVVKLVDLIIFLFTVWSFDAFVTLFYRYLLCNTASENRPPKLVVPRLAIITFGFLLFLWTITRLLPAWYTTPDMMMMGFVFVICGQLLRIKMGATGFIPFAILGTELGFGYLAKAPMFPIALVFLFVAFVLVGNVKKALPRIALAFGVFSIIVAPLVWRLSVLAGGPTFGKSGAWNYARTVNGIGVPYHWHGLPAGSGTPVHPTREIFKTPTVYEFGSPVVGTYPPWRDPYYWFEGITPHFELAGQLRVLKGNAKIYLSLASDLSRVILYGFLFLLCMCGNVRLLLRILVRQWFLLLPAVAALGMFSLVLVEGRYIAPFPIIIGLVLFSGVAIAGAQISGRVVGRTVILMTVLSAVSYIVPAAWDVAGFTRSLHKGRLFGCGGPWQTSSETVAKALAERGIRPGDRIAFIGVSEDFYWARLADVRVNAEIRQFDTNYYIYSLAPKSVAAGLQRSVDMYWLSTQSVKGEIDQTLRNAGSKAIVTDALPKGADNNGWNNVPDTTFYIRMLVADK
jgi:hypothetical protein